MNRIANDYRADASRLLDRLVDGELTEPERRELLAVLDEAPGGWRRCALAFVEAQMLRGDLQCLAAPSPATLPRETPTAMVDRAPAARAWHRPPSHWLGLAAGLALAFTLGFQAAWQNQRPVRTSAEMPGQPAAAQLAQSGQGAPTYDVAAAPPFTGSSAAMFVSPPPGEDPQHAWRTVELAIPDAQARLHNVQLPVVDLNQVGDEWLRSRQQQVALSPVLRAALQESGMRVQEQQRLVPIDLQDGSRIVLPVNRVEVRYDGGRAY